MNGRFRRVALAALLALAGCERGRVPPAEREVAGTLPAAVKVQVDSGNAAYSARDYDAALRHFRDAARRGPDQAVAWYGVQMAATALGNLATADSAGARLRALAPAAPPAVHHPSVPRRVPAPPAASS